MINVEENIEQIAKLEGLHLRMGVCMALGFEEAGEGRWVDPDGNKYPTILDLPPFESDMRWAFELCQIHGLAIIPQSDEKHTWRWLCTDLIAVHYGNEIRLEEKESTAFGDYNPCVAICRTFLAAELVHDYQKQLEQQNGRA